MSANGITLVFKFKFSRFLFVTLRRVSRGKKDCVKKLQTEGQRAGLGQGRVPHETSDKKEGHEHDKP